MCDARRTEAQIKICTAFGAWCSQKTPSLCTVEEEDQHRGKSVSSCERRGSVHDCSTIRSESQSKIGDEAVRTTPSRGFLKAHAKAHVGTNGSACLVA